MAGHNKWSKVRHKKAAQDAKRSRLFTRYIREITVAARMGGADPESNPRLRAAIAAARAVNMPKENIERAIARGAGGGGGAAMEELRLEGYAPGGVAVIVDCITDNRNRTVSEVRSTFTKGGGNLGESGCVAWMFEQVGQIVFDRDRYSEEEIMEAALEAGAEDVMDRPEDGVIEVRTAPQDFFQVQQALEAAGFEPMGAEITWIPKNTVQVSGETARKALALVERLEGLDDVQNVYANYDIPAEELQALES